MSIKVLNVDFFFQIGRGLRLSPSTGKEDCRVIDFVDSLSRIDGVVSVPNLVGLDPAEIDDIDGELYLLLVSVRPLIILVMFNRRND